MPTERLDHRLFGLGQGRRMRSLRCGHQILDYRPLPPSRDCCRVDPQLPGQRRERSLRSCIAARKACVVVALPCDDIDDTRRRTSSARHPETLGKFWKIGANTASTMPKSAPRNYGPSASTASSCLSRSRRAVRFASTGPESLAFRNCPRRGAPDFRADGIGVRLRPRRLMQKFDDPQPQITGSMHRPCLAAVRPALRRRTMQRELRARGLRRRSCSAGAGRRSC